MSPHKDRVRIQNSHVLLPATTPGMAFSQVNEETNKTSKDGNKTNCCVVCIGYGGERLLKRLLSQLAMALLTCGPRGLQIQDQVGLYSETPFQKKM